jgi:mannosyl-oligosaccharide alpha-1,2-mannosidase
VIPSHGESNRDDDEVSILPAALKDRLGMTSDDDLTESSSSTQETAKSDHRVESVSGSDALADDVRSNNIPDIKPDERERFPISEPVIFKPKKPLSHEEYVQDKIERENLPRGFTTIGSASYILR